MQSNVKAFTLRTELFNLLAKFKSLHQEVTFAPNCDTDVASQLDAAACELARVYDSLPEFFTDAARES